jgi:REase_DpnII-MboI
MSEVTSILLDDARVTLLRELSSAVGKHDIYEAFAAWLVPDTIPGLIIEGATEAAVEAAGSSRTASGVATLGYASGMKELNEKESRCLQSGIEWVVGCEPIVRGTPMPFCMDAVTLVGIVLGAKKCNSIQERFESWLRLCREATSAGQGLGEWQEWLMAVVTQDAGIGWAGKTVEGAEGAEVRVSLRSKGFGTAADATSIAKDEVAALSYIVTCPSSGFGISRAAIRLATLDWIRRQRATLAVQSFSMQDLANLLRRVPSGLKKWTWEDRPRTKTATEARQWHVENEYHVQNMLWLVLAPLLPDLIDEDSTPKVGPVQPRADIGIPSLRLIVEAKFMRAEDPPKKMVEQIAEDASLYLVAGSKYDHLMPFIWDDSRRTEHHEEIIRGLRQIAGVVDAIIVPRPGSMNSTARPTNSTLAPKKQSMQQ